MIGKRWPAAIIVAGLILTVLGFMHTPATAGAAPPFVTDPLKPIDLARAATEQYGPSAHVVQKGSHLYDWAAEVGGQHLSLDLEAAVRQQWGPRYSLVSTGVGAYDWAAIDLGALSNVVVPVMVVASDYVFNVAAVADGLANYTTALNGTSDWYRAKVGTSYRYLRPLVVLSDRAALAWKVDSLVTTTPDDPVARARLMNSVERYLPSALTANQSIKILGSVYAGSASANWWGAIARGNTAVVPPRATSERCTTFVSGSACSDTAYAIAHELGHTFGLPHSCQPKPAPAGCATSVMESTKIPEATLLLNEIAALQQTGYFVT